MRTHEYANVPLDDLLLLAEEKENELALELYWKAMAVVQDSYDEGYQDGYQEGSEESGEESYDEGFADGEAQRS